MVDGYDGLPVLSADGQHLQGWITGQSVLRALASQISTSHAQTAQAQHAAERAFPGAGAALRDAPAPLRGYQVMEITIGSE